MEPLTVYNHPQTRRVAPLYRNPLAKEDLMKRTVSLLTASLLLLSLTACGNESIPSPTPSQPVAEATPTTTPEPTPQPTPWNWPEGAPEEQGIDPGMLEKLHADLDASDVRSALVVRNGVLVDEYYKEGFDETSVFSLQSCSKSVTSALVGLAIEQGYIQGVDVPISDYFPHLLDSSSPYAGEITLWHLLTHTTGFYGTDNELWEVWRSSDNWVDYVLEQSIVTRPGAAFNYSTGNSHLLGVIVELATGKSLLEYGKEVLFDPLDMDSVTCGTDPQGNCDGGNGFSMSLRDMAKFGQLFLQGGVWEGKQVIPKGWVEDSTALQFKRNTGSADYGYQWWVRTFGAGQYPAFFAQGHFGQYIFVVPALELVVAVTSHHTGSSSMYWRLMNDIVAGCET